MVAMGCDKRAACGWLETHCGLDPLSPLTAIEQNRRNRARAEASELVRLRQEMIDALKRERDKYFPLFHEGTRWILENGPDTELGQCVADATQIFEERALAAQNRIQRLTETSWPDLVPPLRAALHQGKRAA